MKLKDRIDLLIQSAEKAQKCGLFTLNDAVTVKSAIDNVTNNKEMVESLKLLVKITEMVQKNGFFTLKEAFLMHLATDNILADWEAEEKSQKEADAEHEVEPAKPKGETQAKKSED